MPRIAMATSSVVETDEEASTTRVDDLIQRGRSQGHLSLAELRSAFDQAGLTPAEGRSILRELAESGVRLANELGDSGKPRSVRSAAAPARGAKDADDGDTESGDDADLDLADADVVTLEAEAAAITETDRLTEVDLDDQTPAMGDSVHTYLKSIGRTSLLTAEQEVDLAKRIEAGLFAEHKLEAATGLSEDYRRDLELILAAPFARDHVTAAQRQSLAGMFATLMGAELEVEEAYLPLSRLLNLHVEHLRCCLIRK